MSGLLALLLALVGAGVELFLQVAECLIRQALLVAQGFGKPLHGLLAGRLLPLPLALRDLHVLEHALQFLQGLLRLCHPALLHQLLDAVHHALQVVLRHGHAVVGHRVAILLRLLVLALRLLGKLAHVIAGRIAQFLHQAGDLLVAGAILHGLLQPFLGLAQTLQGVFKIAVLQFDGQIPKRLCDLVLLFDTQPVHKVRLERPDDRAQPQVIGFALENALFRAMAQRAQDLRHAPAIVARPQQVAPLFDDRRGHRVEKPPRRQVHQLGLRLPGQPRGILDRHAQPHGQMRPGMLREIVDQAFLELGAVARDRQRHRDFDRGARFRLGAQAVTAVDRRQVQFDRRGAADHAVIVARGERQGHLPVHRCFRLARDLDRGRAIGAHRDLPFPPAGAVDGQRAGLRDGEFLFGF